MDRKRRLVLLQLGEPWRRVSYVQSEQCRGNPSHHVEHRAPHIRIHTGNPRGSPDDEAARKAVAAERGWPYNHHADGGVIIDYVAERVGDAEMAMLFDSIENLHRNFYEDTYSLPRIRQRLERAKRLFSLLRGAHDALTPNTPMPDDREYRRRMERQARRVERA